MLTSNSSFFISKAVTDTVSTRVDSESPVTRPEKRDHGGRREAWQRVIDQELLAWFRHPRQLDDEGVEAPSKETIQRAILLAKSFRDQALAPPNSVVPDPNGGIVFERREQDVSEALHLWDDGTVEYRCFRGAQLVERRRL